jgi:hypothetical protein
MSKTGFVFNDPEFGTIYIGEDDSDRKRQIQISSASGATVKLFENGGFEIQSQKPSKNDDYADHIVSRQSQGLKIISENGGDIDIRTEGKFTVKASEIALEATNQKSDLIIKSNSNIRMDAGDTLKMTGANVGLGARNKMVIRSTGGIFQSDTTMISTSTSLIPTSLGDLFNKLVENLLFDIV